MADQPKSTSELMRDYADIVREAEKDSDKGKSCTCNPKFIVDPTCPVHCKDKKSKK